MLSKMTITVDLQNNKYENEEHHIFIELTITGISRKNGNW